MSDTWLLLDCPFLCRRAQYSTGSLAFAGEPTGVIYGFLRAVLDLQRRYGTQKTVFCWDGGTSLRQTLYPGYKQKRMTKERTPEEQRAERHYRKQVHLLQSECIPSLGFRNNLIAVGYEADDLLAKICQAIRLSSGDDVVLVSADHDLYQLLGYRVSLWNPASKLEVTRNDFCKKYRVRPEQWAKVKAIAGCSSDEVKGVKGIGEKRACGYLNGSLPEKSRYYQAIEDAWGTVVLPNLRLVTLPLLGTPSFELQEDDVRPSKWKAVTEKLGMGSLRDLFR